MNNYGVRAGDDGAFERSGDDENGVALRLPPHSKLLATACAAASGFVLSCKSHSMLAFERKDHE
jgi:hypothetical protein